MTEQDKVTVDDIIGIIKTEEQTNSVEEVRKLRGRENKTAKRFSYKLDEIFDEGNHFAYALSKENAEDIVELLNELHEENQRLIKMLDNVANYMQKQHKDMPIDDFVEWWNNIATEGLEND